MRRTIFAVLICVVVLAAFPAWSHSFGVRYDLPLPLELYLAGAGVAVALSFAIMALFLGERGGHGETLRFDLLTLPVIGWLGHRVALDLFRALSVILFVLLLGAGFFGTPDPFHNLAPTFVWVVWWVGMAFVSTLCGNLWALVNPWKILFTWAERAAGGFATPRRYPAWSGTWPAVALFLVFAWLELISESGEQPRILSLLIVCYSAVTWTGMAIYGRDVWLRNGETFAVAYGLLARFAPTAGAGGRWNLRLPAVGLLDDRPAGASTVCFVLLLLTSVTFDGILETPLWAGILEWIAESRTLRPLLISLQDAGVDLIVVIKSAALIVFPAIFIAVYLAFSRMIAAAGGGSVTTSDVAGYFVLSLIPIAIAYHLSHYISYLLIAGQNIIPLASDPLGRGWDLFGTAGYSIDIGIVNAKFVWYVAVTAVVLGHMFAVYLAHVTAMRVFPGRKGALRSQIPMLALMVAYTMISLWILSQPIVN